MNTEQLQLILNALSTMGVEAKGAFIWFLVFDKGLPILGWMAVLGVFAWLAKVGITATSVEREFRELRDLLKVGSSGALLPHEVDAVVRRVKELAANVVR